MEVLPRDALDLGRAKHHGLHPCMDRLTFSIAYLLV